MTAPVEAWPTTPAAAVAAAAPAPSVFYTDEFVDAYVAARPLGMRASTVVERDGVRFPAFVLPPYDPFGSLADAVGALPDRIALSHAWHCYDTRLPGATGPADARAAVEAAARFGAAHGAGLCGFFNVTASSPLAEWLAAAPVRRVPSAPRYRLPLGGPDGPAGIDEYLSALGRSTRRTLRAYWRRAERAGAVVTVDRGPLDGRVVTDAVALCADTARRKAAGYYDPAAMRVLLGRLGEAVTVIRVLVDGAAVAASICFVDDGAFHTWAGGAVYPPQLNWSPNYVLFHAELLAAFASGRPVLEAGRRNDAFKLRHGLRPMELVSFVAPVTG